MLPEPLLYDKHCDRRLNDSPCSHCDVSPAVLSGSLTTYLYAYFTQSPPELTRFTRYAVHSERR